MTTVVCDDAALAAQTGDIETLRNMLISDEHSEYLLRLAIVNNNHNIVQLLLESPYILHFVCTSYRQPIMTLSIRYSSLDMVNSLVTIKCDIGAKHIIYNAVESGRPIEFINGLLAMKANISSRSYYHAPFVGVCKNPSVDVNIVYRLLAVKASLNIRSDDGYDSDSEHYCLCTRIIENCNTNVLRALLMSKCNLDDGRDDNGILGGIVEHAIDLVNNSDEILDSRIDGYYNRLYNTTDCGPITIHDNMIDLLLATQYSATAVHRSVRFIIGNLISWKTDEVACRPICPIMTHKPVTPLDIRIISYITRRHTQYMEYRESPTWGNCSSHIVAMRNRGYDIKIEQVLRRLIRCKVDITSTDNQLRPMDGMSLCKELLFDTVKSAMDMRIRLCELESMYITDTVSPEKRMRK